MRRFGIASELVPGQISAVADENCPSPFKVRLPCLAKSHVADSNPGGICESERNEPNGGSIR